MDYGLRRKGWFPAARRFYEEIGEVSNFPIAYVYAMFLAISGHLIGRNCWFWYGRDLYPNHYICLVGPSGTSRKSTAMSLGDRAVKSALGDEWLPPLRQITTSPGLLLHMQNTGGHTMVVLDEIASVLTKSKRQDFAADLIARLVELYDCPNFAGTHTRKDPIEVDEPFLTFVSGSTTDWLRRSLTTSDLMAGFGNRMSFVLGTPRKAHSLPRRMPTTIKVGWDRLLKFKGEIRMSDAAFDVWDDFYTKFEKFLNNPHNTPFVRVMSERIPEKILKAAIVASVWAQTRLIDDIIMEGSVDWGRYLHNCVKEVAPSFEETERQLMAFLHSKGGEATKQDIDTEFGHRIASRKLRDAIDQLQWLGLIHKPDGNIISVKED